MDYSIIAKPQWKVLPFLQLDPYERRQRVEWELGKKGITKNTHKAVAKRLGVSVTTMAYWRNPEFRKDKLAKSKQAYHGLPEAERKQLMEYYRVSRPKRSEMTPEQLAKMREKDRKATARKALIRAEARASKSTNATATRSGARSQAPEATRANP